MALPININELIAGGIVESERIEYKEGWNPEAILHSLCAFANDINNWGGGYIIIGIKSQKGRPVLPPEGLPAEQIEACQKKLLELCHKITPNYFPISSVERYQGQNILVLWAPGGETRPYKVPEKYFRDTRIEIVEYQDDIGDKFTEKIFSGPIHLQLQEALQYIKNSIIKEEVRKIPNQAKAVRYFNYPYVAIEESLANAVYHKSYEDRNPIEVNVRQDRIEILSIPGPVPPIDNKMLKKPVVAARIYRNRRIGDFLKELDLTEGRSTGFPKIRHAMKINGSPPPVFETNKNREYFLAILPIQPQFRTGAIQIKKTEDQVCPKSVPSLSQVCPESVPPEIAEKILFISRKGRELLSLMKTLGQTNRSRFRKQFLKPLINIGLLEYMIPDKPKSSKQKYKTTTKGLGLLNKGKEVT